MTMKYLFIGLALVLGFASPGLTSYTESPGQDQVPVQSSSTLAADPHTLFLQHIPFVAEAFVGMPFMLGGLPARSGSTDNSSLFFSIYAKAAQKAGLVYQGWLPMEYLLANTDPVSQNEARNGDLVVLEDGLAAMIYRAEPSGRLHLIYASEKRQQVFSFHTGNLVYQIHWLDNLKGFYRLKPEMLKPAR